MELIAKADVVLALGTRLNPFSTLPGYGIDYWPKTAKIIQVDINADRIGLTKPVTVGICGDAKHGRRADPRAAVADRPATPGARSARRSIHRPSRPGCSSSPRWTTRTTIPARPGTRRAQARSRPHVAAQAWRAIQAALPQDAIISTRHRQQLRDRQCLPDLRAGPEIPGAGPVRSLRLWLPVDHRRQDRLPGHAGGRLCRRRRLRHLDERDDARSAARNGRRSPW